MWEWLYVISYTPRQINSLSYFRLEKKSYNGSYMGLSASIYIHNSLYDKREWWNQVAESYSSILEINLLSHGRSKFVLISILYFDHRTLQYRIHIYNNVLRGITVDIHSHLATSTRLSAVIVNTLSASITLLQSHLSPATDNLGFCVRIGCNSGDGSESQGDDDVKKLHFCSWSTSGMAIFLTLDSLISQICYLRN